MIESPLRSLSCAEDDRRKPFEADDVFQGIDFVEVVTAPPADNQYVLEVRFIQKDSAAGRTALAAILDDIEADPTSVTITGGVRVRDPKVTSVDADKPNQLIRVRVHDRGDFSTYTLSIRDPAHTTPPNVPRTMDPAYSQVDFSFKAGCPSRFDCAPRQACPPEPRVEPMVDYMAKDYASFRQALIDAIPTIAPDWLERHEADLGIALVELFAYAGDLLSYQQDAVANEAYLETARRRESVARHTRLIDHRLYDGASARAFLQVDVRPSSGAAPNDGTVLAGTQVLTEIAVPIGPKPPPHPAAIRPSDPLRLEAEYEQARAATAAIFEVAADTRVAEQLNRVELHAWGRQDCCLPRGARRIDLLGRLARTNVLTAAWRLRPGSFLLFEEVLGPATGLEADADPAHRQVVRLTDVALLRDELLGLWLTRVEWDQADALRFPLCLSAEAQGGGTIANVSVARGNLVLADHGETRVEWYPDDPGWGLLPSELAARPPDPGIVVGERPYSFRLGEGPLAQRVDTPAGAAQSVADLLAADPGEANPEVTLRIGTSAATVAAWGPTRTLIGADAFAQVFVVETDDAGRAGLRFGDSVNGTAPPNGAYVQATYRVGVGRPGNVGRDSLVHMLSPGGGPALYSLVRSVRNPLPAWGGTDPEPVAHAKRIAPVEFRAIQYRAVTEADYAEVAERREEVQKAVATFRWTGSWHTVFLSIDPRGTTVVSPQLHDDLLAWMTRFTQAGYDLELQQPIYVPLELLIDVCADRYHFRHDVEAAVLEALATFFAPDNFTFGQKLYLSELYAAVTVADGVDSATVRRFARLRDDDPVPARPLTRANVDRGYIDADRLEILRLDNDPSLPENGSLAINMGGGR